MGLLPSSLFDSGSDPFFQADLSDEDFEYFRKAVYERVGIHFQPKKQDLVRSRLLSALRRLGFTSFSEYRELLSSLSAGDAEWEAFTNLLTTNKTQFFREPEHFEFLAKEILAKHPASRPDPFRIWSCASSSGEEIYTLAMVAESTLPEKRYEILGSDIDTEMLSEARNAVYRADQLNEIPAAYHRFVNRGRNSLADWFRIDRRLKERVAFIQHNLLDPPNGLEDCDVIFCRNVLIYFDKKTVQEVVNRLHGRLRTGGTLFVSHSEAIQPNRSQWERVFASVYRKK